MTACPSRAELRRYVTRDTSLEPEEVARLEQHIESCEACQGTLDAVTTEEVPTGTTLPDLGPQGYRVYRLLGTGAFGEVWLAQDLNLPRVVALKTLRVREDPEERAVAMDALRHEARLLTAVDHPNVVRVHAWLSLRGDHYLVMQYVSGGSLAGVLKDDGPLHWSRAARYVADVGEGLLAVHAQGIVHRDIKPANILWDRARDEALLTDFGIGARLGHEAAIAGSLPYMGPDAYDGRVSPALDVYGLAATLFHLVIGAPPFPGPSLSAFREQATRGLPDPEPRFRILPEPIEQVIRSGLHAQPDQRPPLDEFVAMLRASLNQLLADTLMPGPGEATGADSAQLRLQVSRDIGSGRYEPVATTHPVPARVTRDMKRVPLAPEQVCLRTGDRVRVEVLADRAGYLMVFNVGPTGALNLLHPDEYSGLQSARVEPHQPLHAIDVEMTPPAGRERIFAVWSREPIAFSSGAFPVASELEKLSASVPYRATRDMKRVQQTVRAFAAGDRSVVVLELNHVGP